ncbi:MAG: hypothetical protein HOH95_05585 [Dehalococcoidia bacterium]|nr:hypothetical protein [Dehalococcoidia bacterium]
MQVGTLSLPGTDAGLPSELAPRGARARAALSDLGVLLGGALVAVLVSLAYLLVRTSWGATDASDFDSALAAALLLAVPPTWAMWLLMSAVEHRATPGQRHAGLVVARDEGAGRGARARRMALHPISLPFWFWVVAVLLLLGVPLVPWAVLLWSALVGIGGLASVVLLAVRPRTPAVHDWVARTRVVVQP